MEKEIEKIIKENQFSNLSKEDLQSIEEWVGSEEEFEVLKQILMTAESLNENVAPSPKLRESLTDAFNTQYSGKTAILTNKGEGKKKVVWLRFAVSAAAIFVVLMLLFPIYNNDQQEITASNTPAVPKEKAPQFTEKKVNSTEELEQNESNIEELGDGIRELPNQLATVNSSENAASSNPSNSFYADADLSSVSFFNGHSDRLVVNDLPEESRQVIQENPGLLDILYTSF